MTVLITGGTGQLGTALRLTKPDGRTIFAPRRSEFDLAKHGTLSNALDRVAPAVVINAAAFTDVDGAESEPELADRVNREAPAEIAAWCAANGARLIHVSTDFVFGGAPYDRPIVPDTPTAPVNAYGRTKAAGEDAVRTANSKATILRTSWLYGPEFGTGFVDRMLRLSRERQTLSAVTDQVGSPTTARALAQMIWHVLSSDTGYGETHHAVCKGSVSRFELIEKAVENARALGANLLCEELLPASSKDFPAPAARPAFSALDTETFQDRFGIEPPSWQISLRDHVESIMPALRNSDRAP